MKNKFYTIATLLVMGFAANAQVGIGTTTPDASSMLDVTSTSKGLLAPRLSTAQRTAISLPAKGLTIYNLTTERLETNIGTPATPNWQPAGGASAANNIYTNNGTLTSARTVTQNGLDLNFTGSSNVTLPGTANGKALIIQGDPYGKWISFDLNSNTSHNDPIMQFRAYQSSAVSRIGTSGSNFGIYTQGSESTDANLSTPALYVANDGNVNVGTTTNPNGYKLQVSGQAIGVVNTGAASFTELSNGTSRIRLQNNNGVGFVGTMDAFDFNIFSGGASRMVVAANGNVGVGTTAAPASLFQVNGVITATKIQGPSDSRFKKNIKPIENALDKVMKLGGYTYDWKDASEFPTQSLGKGHDMGVIAQEVEKQFPEAVSTNAEGFKAVSYTELVPALIEAMKAQQAQIEELKAAVAKLKK